MTEEIPATPGWVEERLDELFGKFAADQVRSARRAYSSCLAGRKMPAAPTDLLGAEFDGCRSTLRRELQAAGVTDGLDQLETGLEALEAEFAGES